MNTSEPILSADALIKRFSGVVALKGVSFDLRPGEVHAICGENGAGKSTLIKLLGGIHPAGTYEGEVRVDGKPVQFYNSRDAENAGIAVIYQELALVPELTVAENIFLGVEPRRFGGLAIDWPKAYRDAAKLLSQFKLNIPADARVNDLGIGYRQLVEIAKALGKKSRVLILDEPTAALTEQEVDVLLDIIRDLRARGIAIVYISHKLDEVFAIADRITVLRDGASVASLAASETSKDDVIRRMVGREIADLFPRRASHPGDVLLSIRDLSVESAARKPLLHDISLDVRAGEVLGIGGLMGAGRTELLMHVFGALGRRTAGTVTLDGKPLSARHTPSESIDRGLVLISEDRKRYGLVLDRSIGFNMSLSSLPAVTNGPGALGIVNVPAEAERSRGVFKSLRVKAPGLETIVGGLSGGNQQKVVIGKSLLTDPRVVLLDEPTRGIDVGAKIEVYELINELTAQGRAVVLVSSELPELMGMSDRIVMLSQGHITGEFTREEATQEKLLAAAMADKLTPVETGIA
ncbi:MAG: D-xylose transport ATP-binding protein XylG [Phycisphaerales bacterium]|nr:D-xylose transport ATP-binding protein XylG [Phycisphaerales bacterium]